MLPAASPATAAPSEQHRVQELGAVLGWLAKHVDLASPPELLEVGFTVSVGGRVAQLQRVVQWRLPSAPGGRLRLSAPVEHQNSLGGLLAAVQRLGRVDGQTLASFAAVWDPAPGELHLPAAGGPSEEPAPPEPSLLLARRQCPGEGLLVATWPSVEALRAFHAARQQKLAPPPAVATAAASTQAATTSPAAGSEGPTTGAPAPAPLPAVGERVAVLFSGRRYPGTLLSKDGTGMAHVKCDTDAPGILTVTPMCYVRPLLATAAGGPTATTGLALVPGRASICEDGSGGSGGPPQRGGIAGAGGTSPPATPTKPQLHGRPLVVLVPGHRRTRSSAL